MTQVRRLPITVEPSAGESLRSWLMRQADALACPPGAVAKAVGLPLRPGWTGGARVVMFGLVLPDFHLGLLRQATGLGPEQTQGLLLSTFDGSAVDLAGLDPTDEGTLGEVARREWFLPHSTRACPACLAQAPVWQTWWRLGIAACCPIHQCLLVDLCPSCRVPLTRGHLTTPSGLSVVRQPALDECQSTGSAGACRQRLSDGRSFGPAVLDPLMNQFADGGQPADHRLHAGAGESHAVLGHD